MLDHIAHYILIYGTGALSLTGAIMVGLRRAYTWAVTTRKWVEDFLSNVQQDRQVLKDIKKELQPNSGSSLRDVVNRISDRGAKMDKRIELCLDSMNTAIFESGPNGKCISINAAYMKLANCTIDDMRGNDWMNVICEKDRQRVWNEWTAAVSQERHFGMHYCMVPIGVQTNFDVSCEAHPVWNEQGLLIGYVGTVRKVGQSDLCTEASVSAANIVQQSQYNGT